MRKAPVLLTTLTLLLSATWLPGHAQQPRPEYIADEVVALVGNSSILFSDLDRTTREVATMRLRNGLPDDRPARDEAMETLLLQKLLAEHARADSLGKDLAKNLEPQVEKEVQRLIEEAGSVRALEKRYGKEIFSIKDDLLQEAEDFQLSGLMQAQIMNRVEVSYKEVSDFYQTIPQDSMGMIPEQYVYAQIVRMPMATDERKFEVRQKLLEYRQRILDGENMGALARLYSMEPGAAQKGGEWGPNPINNLVYPIAEALETLKPGRVSEIIESEYGYHIVELISKQGDMVKFRQILLKPEFTLVEREEEFKLLDSLSKAVGTDRRAFEEAVLFHSMDKETYQNGGIVFDQARARSFFDTKYASPRFFRDNIPPADYRPLSLLQEGEVSPPYESMDMKGNTIFKIVRLNEIIPTHYANLQQDYEIIEEYALMDKQNRILDQWIHDAIRKMYVWISPEYRDLEFERNWLKK